VCGRPYLVEEAPRLAELVTGADWRENLDAAPGPAAHSAELHPTTRARLAHHWQDIGLMEHASIAAFARFSLQLLSVGAPPALVEASTRAMQDETVHAKLAFELASHYGQEALDPGVLPLDGALASGSLESIVRNTVLEGCIGETVAALEAEWAEWETRDERVRGVLLRIAKDERRHAELAWQFVKWAVERQPELAPRLLEVVARQVEASSNVEPPTTRGASLRRYGAVSESERYVLRRRALETVVLPCMQALCAAAQHQESRVA
jgi:hypothetical protein